MGRLRSLLILLLIGLGLGQSIAYLFDSKTARAAFRASGASPLPLIFAVHEGHEYWSPHYHLEVTTRWGRKDRIRLGSEHFRAIEGPYKLKLVTIGAVVFSELQSDRQLRWGLGRRLCGRDGDLNQIFGINEDLVALKIVTEGRSRPYRVSRNVSCDDSE